MYVGSQCHNNPRLIRAEYPQELILVGRLPEVIQTLEVEEHGRDVHGEQEHPGWVACKLGFKPGQLRSGRCQVFAVPVVEIDRIQHKDTQLVAKVVFVKTSFLEFRFNVSQVGLADVPGMAHEYHVVKIIIIRGLV